MRLVGLGATAAGPARQLGAPSPAEMAYGGAHDLACFLVYAPEAMPLADVVRLAGSRWRIDNRFKLAKGQLELDHYEALRGMASIGISRWLCWRSRSSPPAPVKQGNQLPSSYPDRGPGSPPAPGPAPLDRGPYSERDHGLVPLASPSSGGCLRPS